MSRNNSVRFVPVYKDLIIKNPNPLFPIDYEKIYGKDRVWYDDEPIFDNQGNYIETKRNQYVAVKQLIRMYAVKKKTKCDTKFKNKPLFELKRSVENEEEN